MRNRLLEATQFLPWNSCIRVTGRVSEVTGLTVVAEGLPLTVGSMCRIGGENEHSLPAQVVGLHKDRTILMTLREPWGIGTGHRVTGTSAPQVVRVGTRMVGSVLDGLGRPIGGRTDFPVESQVLVYGDSPAPLARRPIEEPLPTGVRVIDALHTLGRGQRVGIFAGTGVGKSVLMGMIARMTSADVVVVGLIGERGREVGDFLRRELGEEGMARSVVVVSTSQESPVLRVRAGFVATAVAEYFRDEGAQVLLLMDSVTRIAMAQRQIGVAAGEPPTTKGYPPSVFDLLPKLMERSGKTARGSITALYTVLVEGDDVSEPISDAARGILDGHLWLARGLANRGHYPAVSPLESVSRVMTDVVDAEHREAAAEIRRVLASWTDVEDLVNVGAYVAGANPDFDAAVRMKPALDDFLRQGREERDSWEESRGELIALARDIKKVRESLVGKATSAASRKNGKE
jgi:FliI/YscN family ATPase